MVLNKLKNYKTKDCLEYQKLVLGKHSKTDIFNPCKRLNNKKKKNSNP
jgi:hypothetical protein